MSEAKQICTICAMPMGDIGQHSTTLMFCEPIVDQDGRVHHHDTNTRTAVFACCNGHKVTQYIPNTCWCGWTQERHGQS